MKRKVVSLILLSIIFVSGCAGWKTSYQQIGRYQPSSEVKETQVNPDDIAIYVQEYPEGFNYQDGLISVEKGYEHKIHGDVKVEFKPVNTPAFMIVGLLTFGIAAYPMMTPPDLTQDEAVKMLQLKAAEAGANAIIGVVLPSDANQLGGARGIAVTMSQ